MTARDFAPATEKILHLFPSRFIVGLCDGVNEPLLHCVTMNQSPTRIAFINGKGGVGKTTVALLFAAALQEAGRTVSMIDGDPQMSATTLAPNLGLNIGDQAEFIVIDTPPNPQHPATLQAVATSDLAILITTPSPTDLGATAATAALIQGNRHGRTQVLFNRVQASNRFADTLPQLAAQLPFPTLKHYLNQRTAYQVAQLEGWRSMPPAARKEIIELTIEIIA